MLSVELLTIISTLVGVLGFVLYLAQILHRKKESKEVLNTTARVLKFGMFGLAGAAALALLVAGVIWLASRGKPAPTEQASVTPLSAPAATNPVPSVPPVSDPKPAPPPIFDPRPSPPPIVDPNPPSPPPPDPKPSTPVSTEPDDGRVYLSDLPEYAVMPSPQGWTFGKNGLLGDSTNKSIKVNGQPAKKGLGTHPTMTEGGGASWDIFPAETFRTQVGLNDDARPFSPVIFEVFGDGRRLWQSQPIKEPGRLQDCRLNVRGVKKLDLRATIAPGGSITYAHAVWIDPYIIRPTSTSKPPPPPAVEESSKLVIRDLGQDATTILPCLSWAADGKSFWCLDSGGLLRRLSLENFKEEQGTDLKERCSWMSPSAVGWLVALADTAEIVVLDKETLQIKKRIVKIPNPERVLSAASLKTAVVSGVGLNGEPYIAVLDLETGKAVNAYTLKTLPSGSGIDEPLMTPDGRFVLARGTSGPLVRFRLNGKALTQEETSGTLSREGRVVGPCLSPDGEHVCLPAPGGNVLAQGATFVFPVARLRESAYTLPLGEAVLIGFDPKAGRSYAQVEQQLLVFDNGGKKLGEYPWAGGEVRQYLAHPEGKKGLVLTARKLRFVQFPD